MLRRIVLSTAVVVLAAAAAQAQEDKRGELGLFLGTTSSSGISSNDVTPLDQPAVFVEAKPKNGFTWGADLNYFVNERFQVGALYSIQKSDLQFTVGSAWTNVGQGLDVQNMMGTVTFNTGSFDSKTRFYILGGLGATRYGNVTLANINGENVQIGGKSKFATTWGAGLKFYPSPKIGAKAQVRYTPTNIKDTADEWLCAPYHPASCAAGGVNHQYASQWEFTGGVFLRF
jgi:opacity protein-like surface antigen